MRRFFIRVVQKLQFFGGFLDFLLHIDFPYRSMIEIIFSGIQSL